MKPGGGGGGGIRRQKDSLGSGSIIGASRSKVGGERDR